MKVLITGPLKDFSGYAHAGRNMIKTLSSVGIDVVARHLKYDDYKYSPTELEQKKFQAPLRDCDVVMQFTTPNEIRYIPGKMNIAVFYWETTQIPKYWVDQLNTMDLIMVPCRFNAEVIGRSGVRKPIVVCAPPFDMNIYNKPYEKFKLPRSEGRVIYYNICQISAKKGIDVLLKAYFRAFYNMPEKVMLVLKTYINMVNRNNEMAAIKNMVQNIKQGLRLPIQEYPPVYIIDSILDDEDIYRLHAAGDVYVCSSRGEGWGIPPFEAMAMGKTVVSNNWGGLAEFVTADNAIVYGGCQGIVFDQRHSDPFLYTGMDAWFQPDECQLTSALRMTYEAITNPEVNKQAAEKMDSCKNQGIADTRKFDYRTVGVNLAGELRKLYSNWKENGYIKVEKPKEQTDEVNPI